MHNNLIIFCLGSNVVVKTPTTSAPASSQGRIAELYKKKLSLNFGIPIKTIDLNLCCGGKCYVSRKRKSAYQFYVLNYNSINEF